MHKLLVNRLVKLAQEKLWLGELGDIICRVFSPLNLSAMKPVLSSCKSFCRTFLRDDAMSEDARYIHTVYATFCQT